MKLLSKQELVTEMVRRWERIDGSSPPNSVQVIFSIFSDILEDIQSAMAQSVTVQIPTTHESPHYKVYGRSFKEQDEIMRFEGEAPVHVPLKSCNHAWKTYTGLREVFEYCQHCDRKKDA